MQTISYSEMDYTLETKICEICGYQYLNINDHHSLTHMNLMIPHLYLGPNTYNFYELRHFDINTVVNVAVELHNIHSDGFNCMKFNWGDKPSFDILSDLDNVVDKIHSLIDKEKNVFVHCVMGVSRSASVIIAYLMKYNKMDYDSAFKHVKLLRSCVNPNSGFVEQLKIYGENLKNKLKIDEEN